jgi:hypothetical protein
VKDDEPQPSDEKERILSLTRARVVNGFTHYFCREEVTARAGNIGGRAYPTCATWRTCSSFGPTKQWFTSSRVFPRWPHMVFVSIDVMVAEIFELLEQYIVRSKHREPMSSCKHLFICSRATLIRSIEYTSMMTC